MDHWVCVHVALLQTKSVIIVGDSILENDFSAISSSLNNDEYTI